MVVLVVKCPRVATCYESVGVLKTCRQALRGGAEGATSGGLPVYFSAHGHV